MILLYHNLVPDGSRHGYNNQSLTLFESDFRRQVQLLSKIFDIIPLEEYFSNLINFKKPKPKTISITFDDGTFYTYDCLKRVTEEINFNATIFISTCQIDDGPLIYGSYLNALCYEGIYNSIDLNGELFSLSDTNSQNQSKRKIIKLIKNSNYNIDMISKLMKKYPISNYVHNFYRGMSSDQIVEAFEQGNIQIGSHSVNHYDLEALNEESQRSEIFESKLKLEKIIKGKIMYFAYPNGSYNEQTISLVKEAGYSSAFAVKPKQIKHSFKYQIPRVGIYSKSILKLIVNLFRYSISK